MMPIIDKLLKQEPESLPFRMPVDPVALNIPVSITLQNRMFYIIVFKKKT